jgi:hypothetical protein
MAPGLQVVARDNKGNIKQDYAAYRDDKKGRVVEIDELKKKEAKVKSK